MAFRRFPPAPSRRPWRSPRGDQEGIDVMDIRTSSKIDDYHEFREAITWPHVELFAKHGFAAFDQKQFERGLQKLGLEEGQRVTDLGGGMFIDSRFADDFIEKLEAAGDALHHRVATDPDFARRAFLEEIENHEYLINGQAAWDVCNAFSAEELRYSYDKDYPEYLAEAGYPRETVEAFKAALAKHIRDAVENEWY